MGTVLSPKSDAKAYLPALTGIRFFAIFHIFLHHLWAVHNYLGGEGGIVEGIFPFLNNAPAWFITFMANVNKVAFAIFL